MMISLNVDDVYDIIGHMGVCQCMYFIALAFPHYFVCHHMLLNVFVGLETSFTCFPFNSTFDAPLNNECPENSASLCRFEYNSSFQSIAQEWHLVCDEKYKLPLAQSTWMGGVLAGALFLGGLADQFGRLVVIMGAILGTIVFDGISSFSSSYLAFVSLRFLGGACCSLIILTTFVLTQEIVGASKRSFCAIVTGFFFAIGLAILAFVSSVINRWRPLTFWCSVSGVGFLLLYCFVPESPRWLLKEGRADEAKKVLQTMANMNLKGHLLPDEWSLKTPKKRTSTSGVRDLFVHPYLIKITLLQIFSWFVTSATYYALTMAATNVRGDIFVSTAINALTELPAAAIALLLADRLGRRLSICCMSIGAGTACLFVPIIARYVPAAINILVLAGKLCITANFSFIYIHSGEIFPTAIRSAGISIVSVAARVGGIASPFILTLRDVRPNLEFFVLGTLILTAGFLTLKLPETLGRPMPETIDDIIDLGNTSKKQKPKYARLLLDDISDVFAESSSEEEFIRK